jgi:hypothetical protein
MRPYAAGLNRRPIFLTVTLAALAAMFAVAYAPGARAETELRWKFKPDEVLNYVMTMDMAQDMKISNMNLQVKVVQQMDMTWKVTGVEADGTATLTQTIDRIRMDMNVPGQPAMKFDTASDEKVPGAEMLKPVFDAMVGKPITLKVTPRGEITELKISEEMLAGIKKSVLSQMGGMFSEDGMKQMIGRGMLTFPAEAVSKGASWDTSLETANSVIGKQVIEMRYVYEGPEERGGRPLDKIGADMTMKFEESPDAKVKVNVKEQSSDGTIYFDNAGGHVAESNVTSKMALEIDAGGMTVLQDVTTLVNMKLAKPAADEKSTSDKEPSEKKAAAKKP